MTPDKLRALIDRIAAANYTNVSQFPKPSWPMCQDKRFWIEDATRAMDIALSEIIEDCAEVAESSLGRKSKDSEFAKGLNHAAQAIRKLKKTT